MCIIVKKTGEREVKNSSNLDVSMIPSRIWKDRTLSVLEALVEFLKEERKLSYHEIGVLINRDERNIWTVYSRVKEKRINEKKKKK